MDEGWLHAPGHRCDGGGSQVPQRPVLLIPRRAGEPERDMVWDWLGGEWWPRLGWPVIEGHHDGPGPFSRAAAVNTAAELADVGEWEDPHPWDVAVVVDADTLVDPANVRSAAILAHASGQLTFGYERFAALSRHGTEQVMAGYDGSWEPQVILEFIGSDSSCLAVPRDLWDRVGGFDESFVGWGMEDSAFSLACQAIGRGVHRIGGTAWHLWHPQAEGTGDPTHPIWLANRERVRPYEEAGNDYDRMRALLEANGQWRRFDR